MQLNLDKTHYMLAWWSFHCPLRWSVVQAAGRIVGGGGGWPPGKMAEIFRFSSRFRLRDYVAVLEKSILCCHINGMVFLTFHQMFKANCVNVVCI